MSRLNTIKLAWLLVLMLMMVGCRKAPINQTVEQHWLLESFTIKETNEVVECERLFFGINRMVTVVFEKQGSHGYDEYVARTEYRNDNTVLVLLDFKKRTLTGGGDSGVKATPEQLMPFGIINPVETAFTIHKLSHKRLILESDYARLELRKF